VARVIWSPQALADLRAIGDYLAAEAPAYAQALVDGAFAAVERLEIFPQSGRAVPEITDPDLREVIYRGYRIFHVVLGPEGDEEVEVLAVIHSSRQFGGGETLEG
jgi:toxin ParE1/3/4